MSLDGDGDYAGEGDDADVDDSGGAWLSDRLNRKVSTQLADGFYMVHSALPAWCSLLAHGCRFLLPLETRLRYLQRTALGTSRTLFTL